jgi:putative ABC transport system permease protein
MRAADLIQYTLTSVRSQRGRSLLTMTGIAIGVAAVVLLTAIGEGIHRFVLAEFTQFGTNLIAVSPGKTSTMGMSGALVSNVRPLSLDDARALERVPDVEAVVSVVQGNAAVEAGGRTRRTMVFGAGPGVPEIWSLEPRIGRFLPKESGNPRAFAVLGSKLHRELFGDRSPLGARIRVGGEPYRVIGVMERKGQMLGFDLDDTVYIPVERALAAFDRDSLMEIDLLYDRAADSAAVAARVRELMIRRHGSEDFTITTQDQMLDVLGSVLDVLTAVVGALGGISLAVGGIGILTIMTIAVREPPGDRPAACPRCRPRPDPGPVPARSGAAGAARRPAGSGRRGRRRLADRCRRARPAHQDGLGLRARRGDHRGADRPRRRRAAGAACRGAGPGGGAA